MLTRPERKARDIMFFLPYKGKMCDVLKLPEKQPKCAIEIATSPERPKMPNTCNLSKKRQNLPFIYVLSPHKAIICHMYCAYSKKNVIFISPTTKVLMSIISMMPTQN